MSVRAKRNAGRRAAVAVGEVPVVALLAGVAHPVAANEIVVLNDRQRRGVAATAANDRTARRGRERKGNGLVGLDEEIVDDGDSCGARAGGQGGPAQRSVDQGGVRHVARGGGGKGKVDSHLLGTLNKG